MKIAVTYANGSVSGHFGHADAFKIYDVEDRKVVSSEVIQTEGSGHAYMSKLMIDNDVNVVICVSIGQHAQLALEEAGIVYVAGAEGDADQAVEAYLSGELTGADEAGCAGCGEDDGCGGCGSDEEGCGGGCGGCGGGCGGGAPRIILEGKNAGKKVRVHYRGTFNDGTQFDASYDRGEPLEFICGAGQMIEGFDKAVVDMELGEAVDIHLMPEEAYGMPDPNAIIKLEIAQLPGSEELEVGQRVHLMNQFGQPIPVLVIEKDDTNITFDANHEMAGKELNFHIELVEIEEA